MTNPTIIMNGASPFFHRGGAIGCLCLHGFTATPHEVRWLGQHLAAQGYTVYAPRLAGHGTHPQDLARTHWQDWLASALDAYSVLQQQCEQVFVCGLSMGGLLTLQLSLYAPITAAVVMAAPVLLHHQLNLSQLQFLKYIRPFTDQSDNSPFAESVRQQQIARGEPPLGRVRYDRWSTAAVVQLVQLARATEARLSEITAPLLLLYSEQDKTVSPQNLKHALTQLTHSPRIESHLLQKSGHILTQDVDANTVFKLTSDFIASYKT